MVSLGLLAQMTVDDKFHVGDLATALGKSMTVTATVLGPAWTIADHIELYANGNLLREQSIPTNARAIEKAKIKWTLPVPAHDMYLVALASGPGVTSPHWAIPRPYQPTSRRWEPRVIGSTNPIWVDGDGDGRFTSPRAYAKNLIEQNGTNPSKLLPALGGHDEAVAIQAASLCQAAGVDVRNTEFQRELAAAPSGVQRGSAAFVGALPRETR